MGTRLLVLLAVLRIRGQTGRLSNLFSARKPGNVPSVPEFL